ncbi:hypothetical protein DFH11DRAFT_1547520 [Phellopilus nigrolimitatus]|nr:hypothetical protein DFH11DRAFT_1547520 [Phellopilus nigrolimitatus]
MPSRTFDAWLAYSADFSAKRDVSGKYGVDFRVPEPNDAHRRALRLLSEAKEMNPRLVKANGEQFDYLENAKTFTSPTTQPAYAYSTDSETDCSATPRAELDVDVELDDWLQPEFSSPTLSAPPQPLVDPSASPLSPMSPRNPWDPPNQPSQQYTPHPPKISGPSSLPAPQSLQNLPNANLTATQGPQSFPGAPHHSFSATHAHAHTHAHTHTHTHKSGRMRSPSAPGPHRLRVRPSENALRPAYARRGSVNTGTSANPSINNSSSSGENSAFAVGPYGYRYPAHPPYPLHSSSAHSKHPAAAASDAEHPTGPYNRGGHFQRLEWTQSWERAGPQAAPEDAIDSMGGWGRISDPLPPLQSQQQQYYDTS